MIGFIVEIRMFPFLLFNMRTVRGYIAEVHGNRRGKATQSQAAADTGDEQLYVFPSLISGTEGDTQLNQVGTALLQ